MAFLWFTLSSFFSFLCFYQRLFSPRRAVILLHVFCLAPSSYPASLFGLYDLPFVTCCPFYVHLLHPRSSFSPTASSLHVCDLAAKLASPCTAWQGTDLMHNHVLADVDRSCMDSPGRRSSVSRPELSSDLSEDSDYDSIWTTHSYRMGSVPRKSCISHQN